MAKVYLVTSGTYSDYGVNAVFSTEEKAKEWIGHAINQYYIEEFDLDNFEDRRVKGFNVRMDRDGNCTVSVTTMSINDKPKYFSISNWDKRKNQMDIRIMTDDEETAVKVANEKRTQAIASNDFKTGTYNYDTCAIFNRWEK